VDHDIVVEHAEYSGWIACEFTATALYRLFGIPGIRITGAVVPLEEMRPDLAQLACECFVSSWNAPREEHVAEADQFISILAERSMPGADSVIEQAVSMFEAANGAVRVSEICKAVGIGSRQLGRRFTHIVGIGPKHFGQIMQINWVVGLLYFNDKASLTEIAHSAGFYDQAHFNHAMRRFFSEGPSDFLKSDHVAFKTFLGESRRFGPDSLADGI
jgi:AraC-like DNA-binding protein